MKMRVVFQVIASTIIFWGIAIALTPQAVNLSNNFFYAYALCIYGALNLAMTSTRVRFDPLPATFTHYCLNDVLFHALALTAVLYTVVPIGMNGAWLSPVLIVTGWLVALTLPYALTKKFCNEM